MKGFIFKVLGEILFIILIMLCILVYANADTSAMQRKRATVYTLEGKTAMGTQTRWGVCASGDRSLLGKTIIVYQCLPDNTIGDAIGIFSVEDTGCKGGVIDIWCSKEYQQAVINKTWENGSKGRIYIQTVEVEK